MEFKDNGEFEVTDFSPDLPGRFMMSSCGLSLVCQYPSRDLHVANPVTLKSVALPPVPCHGLGCSIVRVPRTREIKLFASDVLNLSDDWFSD